MSRAVSRRSQLAQIHIAKKQMGMDDVSYRAFLKNNTGLESSGDLDMHGRFKLLKAFENAGWKPKKKRKPTASEKTYYDNKQSRYMIALWNDLFKQNKVNTNSNESFETWVANQIKEANQQLPVRISPDKLDASERNRLIERLKVWVNR